MKTRRGRELIFLLAFSVLLILSVGFAGGEKPKEEWSRTFGGTYGEGAWSMKETADGGYILAGYTSSRGESSDLWLVKTDNLGNAIWDRIFGGSGEDVGYSVLQAKDGGYIVAGSTKSYGMGEELLWILKTDSNGSRLWDRTLGGFVSSSGDGAWSIDQTAEGGYIIAGYTQSFGSGGKDLWLVKTDDQGVKLWDKTFGGAKDDVGMSVVESSDGGYIVTGRTASFGAGGDDIWLLKTSPEGKEQWNTTFGGEKDDAGFQVAELDDGYALVGRMEFGSSAIKKAVLIKTDLKGRKRLEKVYEIGSAGISLQPTSDGGFIIGGRIDTTKSGRDALLIKTDSSGIEQWALSLGGPVDDVGTFVVQSRDGGYVLAGITSSYGSGAEDAWLIKLPAEVQTNANETLAWRNVTVGG